MLEEKFGALLGWLAFDDEVMEWVRDALHQSHADERREHEAAIERLRGEYDRLQNRIHAAYVDKLDGNIDAAFFEKLSAEWRTEQDRCLRTSSAIRAPTSPISKTACAFSNWPRTPNAFSQSRTRARNAGSSISWFRTAPGGTES